MDLYLVSEPCAQGEPSGKDSLLDLYGLREFANSVARQDPETGAKRKLRKSYKNHIADLPGKHPVPGPGETSWSLLDAALRAAPASVADCQRSLEFSAEQLAKIKFAKSLGPLPNFDAKLLAAPGVAAGRDAASNPASPQAVSSPRASSPGVDERLDKRKRREQTPLDKRRRL